MAYHIGVIVAENSLRMIQGKIDYAAEIGEAWQVEYLPYATYHQLPQLYTQNLSRFDGLIFSGRFNYQYINAQVGSVYKPHVVFELADRDYYKLFAQLLYRHPGLDIRRVLMEAPTGNVDLGDLFDGALPTWIELDFSQAANLTATYELVTEYVLRLWREKKIDRVITRFTNLIPIFKEAGIVTERLFPSKASMLESFHDLCRQIQSRQITNTRTVFGVVRCADPTGAVMDQLQNLLDEFNEGTGMSLLVRRKPDSFELATSNETLMNITQRYTNCQLTGFLHQELPQSPVSVGWGIGQDIAAASQKAVLALAESGRGHDRGAYLVTEAGDSIGPLIAGRSVSIKSAPSVEAEQIGKKLGISPVNLQRLMNVQEKRGADQFSSHDLAYYLNITPRSANRILAKLEKYGSARVLYKSQTTPRGRPSNVYTVNWHRLKKLLEAGDAGGE